MKIKIINGTVHGDSHLCFSCAASIIRTEGQAEVTVCREMPGQHPFIQGRVTACTSYVSRDNSQAMNRYQGQAWTMDMGEDGPVFHPPDEWRNSSLRPVKVRLHKRRNPTKIPDDGNSSGGTSGGEPTVQ